MNCQETRIAIMSTSLKTADTGFISRRFSYHLDDVKIEKNYVQDYNYYIIQYPHQFEKDVSEIRNIGLYLVSTLMPPLTQKMLDSFHTASAGEKLVDSTSNFNSLVDATSNELKHIFITEGMFVAKLWLFDELTKFFSNKIQDYWIQLLIDFIFVTGRPIGIGMTKLDKRHHLYNLYSDRQDYSTKPILKFCKYGKPFYYLKKAASEEIIDDLSSHHSRELFF